eukprot:jgi/Botrbrau1/10601/Bobra.0358s0020.1
MLSGNVIGIRPWEEDLAGSVGVSVLTLRFALSFFASILTGYVFRYVPTVKGRHIFAIVTGFALTYYPFGNGIFNLFVPILATYVIMLQIPEYAGTLSWLVNFTYLVVCHVRAASGDAWKEGQFDYTGAAMVLTLKLISIAVAYQDGVKPDQELQNEYQRKHCIRTMPSFLEFLSYSWAAGNLLSGPFFEFSDYKDYINRQGLWDPKAARPMPNPVIPGLLRLLKAVLCMVLCWAMRQRFSVSILETPAYFQSSIPLKIVLQWCVGATERLKYYFAWTASEAALILSGFCFNGWDSNGRPLWNRYSNMRILAVELATSPTAFPTVWNTCTGHFLRHYVYERLTRGNAGSFWHVMATQVVSGVWHGLFPGYAMFFFNSAFMFETGKVIYRYERMWPKWVATFPPWLAVKWLYTAFTLNYSATPFALLYFEPGWRVWRSVSFLGHFLMFSVMLISIVNPPRRPKKNHSKAGEPSNHHAKGAEPSNHHTKGGETSNHHAEVAGTGNHRAKGGETGNHSHADEARPAANGHESKAVHRKTAIAASD